MRALSPLLLPLVSPAPVSRLLCRSCTCWPFSGRTAWLSLAVSLSLGPCRGPSCRLPRPGLCPSCLLLLRLVPCPSCLLLHLCLVSARSLRLSCRPVLVAPCPVPALLLPLPLCLGRARGLRLSFRPAVVPACVSGPRPPFVRCLAPVPLRAPWLAVLSPVSAPVLVCLPLLFLPLLLVPLPPLPLLLLSCLSVPLLPVPLLPVPLLPVPLLFVPLRLLLLPLPLVTLPLLSLVLPSTCLPAVPRDCVFSLLSWLGGLVGGLHAVLPLPRSPRLR
jgi:hypothetical protein